jgi:hypothetical protein
MALTAQDREAIAAQAPDRNTCGRAIAMTLANPVKPGRGKVLRLNFWVTGRIPALLGRLRKLSFIHFARWTIVSEFPYNGPPQVPEQLAHEHMFFISNYNGYWTQYIDAFYRVVPDLMDVAWGNVYGHVKAPAGARNRQIHKLEFTASHYYSAYPEASATMVESALELKRRFDRFETEVRGAGPERFDAAFRRFVAEAQRYL